MSQILLGVNGHFTKTSHFTTQPTHTENTNPSACTPQLHGGRHYLVGMIITATCCIYSSVLVHISPTQYTSPHSLHILKTLTRVCAHLNYTIAAVQLHIANTSVSVHISLTHPTSPHSLHILKTPTQGHAHLSNMVADTKLKLIRCG